MKRSRLRRGASSSKKQRLKIVKPTERNLYTAWDVNDIVDEEVKFRQEEQAEEVKAGTRDKVEDEDVIRQRAYQDTDLFDAQWDMMTEAVSELMEKVNKTNYWVADVENFGWRSQSGTTGVFEAKNGHELLQKVLPKTDCTFKVFKVDGEIRIQNWHHDSPMGNEWYTIRRATAKEIKESGFGFD
jgi:hypothetical protein